MTIDDVGFSLSALAEDCQSVTKSGNSLVLALSVPSETFLEKAASVTIMPKHIFDGKTKDEVTDEQSVVGAGPFKFVTFDKSSGTVTFEKFADYPYASESKFDIVIFKKYNSQQV